MKCRVNATLASKRVNCHAFYTSRLRDGIFNFCKILRYNKSAVKAHFSFYSVLQLFISSNSFPVDDIRFISSRFKIFINGSRKSPGVSSLINQNQRVCIFSSIKCIAGYTIVSSNNKKNHSRRNSQLVPRSETGIEFRFNHQCQEGRGIND